MTSTGELEELKMMIEKEEKRSHKRQHNYAERSGNKEYDFRCGLRYTLRQIEGMLGK